MTMALIGRGASWNTIIYDHHGVNKLVLPNAFDRSLRARAKIKLLLNHFDHQCVGSTDDHLQLCRDEQGLFFRFRITFRATLKTAAPVRLSSGPKSGRLKLEPTAYQSVSITNLRKRNIAE